MPPLKRKKAFAWITVSAVALTGTGAFAQLGIRETSIVFSLFVRFALAALILLVMAPLERLRSLRTIPTVQWLRVGFVMCSQSALFVYLAEGTLLNGMLLYNTGPLFTPLLAWMLWRKTIRATGIVSIVLGFVGVALVLDPTRSALDGMLLVGLASGFFNSCSQLSLYAGGKGGVALSETDKPVPVLHALRRSLPHRAAVPSGRPDERGASAGRERDPRLVRRAQRVRRGEPVRTQRCLPERP